MTNETIQWCLDELNRGSRDFVLTEIGLNVFYGNAWILNRHLSAPSKIDSDKMFFIKDAGTFAGAILWMNDSNPPDLHWYVDPLHRGKKLLLKPLRAVVLPYLFEKFGLESLSATINTSDPFAVYSQRLARKVGFKLEGKRFAVKTIKLEKSAVRKSTAFPQPPPTKEDASKVIEEAVLAVKEMEKVAARLDVQFASTIPPHRRQYLHDAVREVASILEDRIGDLKYAFDLNPKWEKVG